MSEAAPKDSIFTLPGLRRFSQPILTRLSHGSAPFISTFVLIHLSAPVLANLGGSSLSSQVMILGREYYQTSFGEKFLLILPLLVHPLASAAKRLLAPRPARRLTSILSLTGYTALMVLPIHYFVHRSYPANPAPPIYALSPAELDYEYVKYALSEWPVRAWLGYVTLTACVAWHAAEGANVLWNTYVRGALGAFKARTPTARAVIAATLVLPVVSGLAVMAKEPVMAFTSQLARFHASFTQCFVYRY
ncbi:hypothetical protein BKA93DRAFT_725076 [Sparassis latifolia]|uniref:Mitochondrial adapter protein MCP1 transmembrane domain-containing protein n=1 Tax=Sparassis crispa TaxID=139825 RepID=A0A401GKU7_9APHY|nr:hypothetical protein SCP_0411820 [Sparassis crispa]GBE82797.1 hypothetical protein SCP_0411820 [Sparassis crispa]